MPTASSGGRSKSLTRPKQTSGSSSSWQPSAMATAFGCRATRRKSSRVSESPSPNMMMPRASGSPTVVSAESMPRTLGSATCAERRGLEPPAGHGPKPACSASSTTPASAHTRGGCRLPAGSDVLSRHVGSRRRSVGVSAAHRPAEPEVLAQLGDVAGGLDVVLRELDLALLVDDERRADDALDRPCRRASSRRTRRTPFITDRVRVGEQRDGRARRARGTSPASPACPGRCRAPRSRPPCSESRESVKSQACLVQPGVIAAG